MPKIIKIKNTKKGMMLVHKMPADWPIKYDHYYD